MDMDREKALIVKKHYEVQAIYFAPKEVFAHLRLVSTAMPMVRAMFLLRPAALSSSRVKPRPARSYTLTIAIDTLLYIKINNRYAPIH